MKRGLQLTGAICALVAIHLLGQCGCGRDAHRNNGAAAQDYLAGRVIMAVEGRTRLNPSEKDGMAAYEKYCMVCHGSQGKGDGFNAYNIEPRPADLTAIVPGVSDEHIRSVIESGSSAVGKSPLCPPSGPALGEKRAKNVLAYLRKLAGQSESNDEQPATSGETP